ncbi:hypothetical protein CEXT_29371 [Caerostris extrusa]|uniref:Secreted protein n=1 Tax=Caerostris extrusa TaxID=172846 RepID=A0AAV4XFN8_CAEEX|nr:hypothetical protein CEXT_29371 [Caerostris extrusa]
MFMFYLFCYVCFSGLDIPRTYPDPPLFSHTREWVFQTRENTRHKRVSSRSLSLRFHFFSSRPPPKTKHEVLPLRIKNVVATPCTALIPMSSFLDLEKILYHTAVYTY